MVFKFKKGSVPSTETGEMGLKCFFLEQSLKNQEAQQKKNALLPATRCLTM